MQPSPVLFLAPPALLLACGLWVALRRQKAPALPPASEETAAITALVPVRDEQANVADCLAGLLPSPALGAVLIIDDGSSDATPHIVTRAVAGVRHARLLRARPLPPGWRGKVNALSTGFNAVATEWTLLVDADSRLHPEAPARALAHARAHGLAAVSLAARQEAGTFGEDLLVPPVFGLLDFLLGSWKQAAHGGPPVASGQFVLVQTAALRAAGGFEAIRNETLDDVALTRLLRAHGHRTGFVRAPQLLSVRMYASGGAALAGWRRNLAVFLAGRPGTLLAVLAILVLPVLALLALAWRGPAATVAASYSLGLSASLANRITGSQRALTALLWPAECVYLAIAIGLAWLDRRKGLLPPWKGREIKL